MGARLANWFNIIGTLVLGILGFWLNFQIQTSNELLEKQRLLLDEQRIVLDEQKADLQFRLELFDRVVKSVGINKKEGEVVLALVKTLPKSEYSQALLDVLTASPKKEIREKAMTALLKRGDTWIHKEYSPETSGYADFDVFVCGPALNSQATANLLDEVLQSFDNSRTGQIRVRKWTLLSEFSEDDLANKTTVILDKDEVKVAYSIIESLSRISNIPPVITVDNPAKESPWRVRVVLCPQE